MTIRAYITDKLKAYGISEAQLIDVALTQGIDLESDVADCNPMRVGIALAQILEECILAPRLSSVSEGGFSLSWNYDAAGKYYVWLCRKWDMTPNADVLAMLGLSSVIDRTANW